MREEPEPDTRATVPIRRSISLSKISAQGSQGEIMADKEQCATLADILDVRAIEDFHFTYDLSATGRGRFRLSATLNVTVHQDCVVTLEPLERKIDETFSLELWPEKDVALAEKLALEEGRSIELDGPEPIDGDDVDVGQLAYEQLSSLIDPYPRKNNVQFQWDNLTDDDDKPFAALGALLRKETK